MEGIVDKLASSYRDIVEATLSEDGVSEEHRAILLTKFESLFIDKLRLGLAATFGRDSNEPISTEVSVDDAFQRGEEGKSIFPINFLLFCRDCLDEDDKKEEKISSKRSEDSAVSLLEQQK